MNQLQINKDSLHGIDSLKHYTALSLKAVLYFLAQSLTLRYHTCVVQHFQNRCRVYVGIALFLTTNNRKNGLETHVIPVHIIFYISFAGLTVLVIPRCWSAYYAGFRLRFFFLISRGQFCCQVEISVWVWIRKIKIKRKTLFFGLESELNTTRIFCRRQIKQLAWDSFDCMLTGKKIARRFGSVYTAESRLYIAVFFFACTQPTPGLHLSVDGL